MRIDLCGSGETRIFRRCEGTQTDYWDYGMGTYGANRGYVLTAGGGLGNERRIDPDD